MVKWDGREQDQKRKSGQEKEVGEEKRGSGRSVRPAIECVFFRAGPLPKRSLCLAADSSCSCPPSPVLQDPLQAR